MNKKILSAILALLMFVSLITACSSGDADTPNTTTAATESVVEETTEAPFTLDLPDTDMEGKAFTFLTTNWPGEDVWTMYEITIEDLNGNAVNDAMYTRNSKVQERLNCVVAEINIPSSGDAVTALRKSVQAGDNAYDIFLPRMQSLTTLVVEELIVNLDELEYTDFSKPWWDDGAIDGLSLANKLYGANSYMTTMDKGAISTFVFNKSIMEDYNIEQPYNYIRDGVWTLDRMEAQIKQVSNDLDGNGTMDSNDQYGLMFQRDTLHDWLVSSGEAVAKKDAADLPYVSLNGESSIAKIQNMFRILYDTNTCFNVMTLPGDFNVGMNTMFQNNQGLYMWIRMVNIVPLRTMEADFGIAVSPKYDESQTEYLSTVNPYTGIYICVPSSNSDLENTGMFLEAMAYEGYKNVKDAYYDTLLNGIIARDNDSSEMLDILFANRRYDLGIILDMGDLRSFIYMVMTYDDNITSYVETRMKRADADIEKLVTALQK
jgi:hypothetical protein